jgi:hypothetical protein
MMGISFENMGSLFFKLGLRQWVASYHMTPAYDLMHCCSAICSDHYWHHPDPENNPESPLNQNSGILKIPEFFIIAPRMVAIQPKTS